MLPIGAIFAFIGRQLGRVLSLAFSWATMALFGRVPDCDSSSLVRLPDSNGHNGHGATMTANGSMSGDLTTKLRMPAHLRQLVGCQRPGLVEHVIRNAHLADIVERRQAREQIDEFGRELRA